MKDYVIYGRFANTNSQFSLDTKLYRFHYRCEDPSYLVGSIVNIKDEEGRILYSGARVRIEVVFQTLDKRAADEIAGMPLRTIDLVFIKRANIPLAYDSIQFDTKTEKILWYEVDGWKFKPREFWEREERRLTSENEVMITIDKSKGMITINNSKGMITINSEDLNYFADVNSQSIKNEEKNNMFNKMFKNLKFGKLSNGTIKYSFNGIAFQSSDGSYVTFNDDLTFTNVNDMVMDIPVYVMPVAANQIEVGDIIIQNEQPVMIREISSNEIKVIKPFSREIVSIVPEKSIFGFDFYSKVLNVFEGLGSAADQGNPFGNMLPFLMMSEGKENQSNSDMMMMMALMGGNLDMSNPMMMMALMGDKTDSMLSILPMMMMNNKNNKNPFSAATSKCSGSCSCKNDTNPFKASEENCIDEAATNE